MNATNAIPASVQTDKNEMINDLIRRYQRKVINICYGYTRDWEDAKEMAQEAFVKAYQAMDSFEGRCQPITWITRIAINQCLSHLANRGRERLGLLNYVHEQERDGREEMQEEQSSRVDMKKLLGSADKTTRKVLELAFGQGLTHSQIGMTLGVCRVAVTRRIARFKRNVLRLEAAAA